MSNVAFEIVRPNAEIFGVQLKNSFGKVILIILLRGRSGQSISGRGNCRPIRSMSMERLLDGNPCKY